MKSSYKQVVGNQTLPFSVATGNSCKKRIFSIFKSPFSGEYKKDVRQKVKVKQIKKN